MSLKTYYPMRGDIVWTDFDPAAGHEPMGKRPALVLSPDAFNRKIRLALVAPITSRRRGHGFEVHLDGARIRGAVLCHPVKVIDFFERGVRFAEKAPDAVTADVLARVRVLLDD